MNINYKEVNILITFIVICLITILVIFAIIKAKKQGGCGGNCSSCILEENKHIEEKKN